METNERKSTLTSFPLRETQPLARYPVIGKEKASENKRLVLYVSYERGVDQCERVPVPVFLPWKGLTEPRERKQHASRSRRMLSLCVLAVGTQHLRHSR